MACKVGILGKSAGLLTLGARARYAAESQANVLPPCFEVSKMIEACSKALLRAALRGAGCLQAFSQLIMNINTPLQMLASLYKGGN